MIGRDAVSAGAACFALLVFGIVLLVSFYRGDADSLSLLGRALRSVLPAAAVGGVLGYLGFVVLGDIGVSGQSDNGGSDDGERVDGGKDVKAQG